MIFNSVPFKSIRTVSEQLALVDDDWALLIGRVGPSVTPSPQTIEPYEALIRAIAVQHMDPQIGAHRLDQFISLYPNRPFPTPRDIVMAGAPGLEACGFSRSKAQVLVGIAKAAADGVVPSRRDAVCMSDDDMVARLADLPGVGRWTVDMFLINSLGRMDVLAADDFMVCEGYRHLKGLQATPTPEQMRVFSKKWAPVRSTATYYLMRCKAGFRSRDPIARIPTTSPRLASAITLEPTLFHPLVNRSANRQFA